MKSEAGEQLRKALRRFMEMKHLTVAGWAREADLSEGTLRNFLAGTSDTLTHATLAALAGAARQPVSALLMPADVIDVEFEVSASAKKDPMERFTIYLPPDLRFPNVARFGAIIRDRSAEQLYLPGSIVICVNYYNCLEAGRGLRTGDHVLIAEDHGFLERRPHGFVEHRPEGNLKMTLNTDTRFTTIRTVSISRKTGKLWLSLPTGLDWLPEHMSPSLFFESLDDPPSPEMPKILLLGLIVASYSLEPLPPHDNATQG